MRVIIAARRNWAGIDPEEQEVVMWAAETGHEVVAMVPDHRSAGPFLAGRPNLRAWLTEEPNLARYDAVACLKVDRLTSPDDESVSALQAWAREHRKQLRIVSADAHYPSRGANLRLWNAHIKTARREWQKARERFERMRAERHDAGSFVGPPPWGYKIVALDGIKTIEPTPEGLIWVPRVFGWIAGGRTCEWVAQELDRRKVRPPSGGDRWLEATIPRMIRRTTYSGLRERKGREPLEVPALVTAALQDKAIAALAARARGGRGSSGRPKPLLGKLACGHPDCPGKGTWPMYRVTNRQQHVYYRCTGKPPQRRGCGAPMVRADELESLVLDDTLKALDVDGQRACLAGKDIRAWKDPEGTVCASVDGIVTRNAPGGGRG